jgi:hypothetical protein
LNRPNELGAFPEEIELVRSFPVEADDEREEDITMRLKE